MECFDDLINKPNKSELEKILVESIALLMSHPGYCRLQPHRVFELVQQSAAHTKW